VSKKASIFFDQQDETGEQQGDTGEPKLEHWYGRIGISAVVAALPFTTTKEKSIQHSQRNDEKSVAKMKETR
jgi:hypothetical protein